MKWVAKLGPRKLDWILLATPLVIGLMKKGTEEFLISNVKFSRYESEAEEAGAYEEQRQPVT